MGGLGGDGPPTRSTRQIFSCQVVLGAGKYGRLSLNSGQPGFRTQFYQSSYPVPSIPADPIPTYTYYPGMLTPPTHTHMHKHTHTYMHKHTHTHECMHTNAHTHSCTHRLVHTHTHAHAHIRTCVDTHKHTHLHARTNTHAHA